MTYIFDFDGTLVDSMPVFSAKMRGIFESLGLPVEEDFVKIITPLGYVGTAGYAKSLGMALSTEEFVQMATESMVSAYHNTIPAKAQVEEALLRLKGQGHSLNVLTASPHSVLDACLKRLGLDKLFDHIWSCNDFSMTKSDPRIYVAAAEKLGKCVGECIFLDDNLGAVTTAKQAGMYTIGVFDPSSEDCVEQMKATCDAFIYDFSSL